jgi:cytochrome b561
VWASGWWSHLTRSHSTNWTNSLTMTHNCNSLWLTLRVLWRIYWRLTSLHWRQSQRRSKWNGSVNHVTHLRSDEKFLKT